MKKAARLPGLPCFRFACCLLGSVFAETVAEALNASTHIVHGLLGSRVEGVRLARGVEFVKGEFAAIVHFHHFFGVDAGAGDEFEAIGQIQEANVAVIGVNARFHIFFHQQ